MEGRYKVLTQDDLRSRQKEDIHNVAELLSIASGLTAVLLRHCQWTPERVQGEWFDNGEALRIAVGLPPSEEDVAGPKVLTRITPNCLCFDSSSGWAARSAGCSHYYCDDCWRRYIRVEMDEGPRCLPLRCPDPFCEVPVVREVVVEVIHYADTKALYDHFMLRSYVDDSGGRIKWCQGHGCSRAVEFIGGGHGDSTSTDVVCDCRHGFCWTCDEEPHRPVSCDAARAWMEENTPQASLDDESLEKAVREMEELKRSWLGNMAATLGVEVMDLGFLTEAYEEIAEYRRRIRWVHAYGYYYLDTEAEGDRNNKRELFDRLLIRSSAWKSAPITRGRCSAPPRWKPLLRRTRPPRRRSWTSPERRGSTLRS